MKIIRYIASVLSAITVCNGFADGNIYGSVFNKTTSEPVDFATVSVVAQEKSSSFRRGVTTDERGSFFIKDVPSGKYIITFSNVGSIPQEREINLEDENMDLGSIYLSEDVKLLQEVSVVAQKSQVSINPDKRVFNVSSNIASTGASAEELLASVPSVAVNAEGDISLRGNNDVLVWINGKEMGMNADNRSQFLRQIPAESIESIEVMTNPSAKNSTEGTAGIINIRLRKNHTAGYFGGAEANVDSRGSFGANFNINFNKGKFESFAGIGLKSSSEPGGMHSLRSYSDGEYLKSDGKIKNRDNSMFLRIGTDFTPDEHNILYLSAIGTMGNKSGSTNTVHLSDLPQLWDRNNNIMREKGNNIGANIILGYKHNFKPDHFLDVNVSYNIWHGSNNDRIEETEIWEYPGSEEVNFRSQHQKMNISNWEAALDYSNRICTWLRLEAGYKGNFNRENSPASYYEGISENDLKPLDNLYNRFKYATDIHAAYITLSGDYNNLSFSAGLRGEGWRIATRSLGFGQTDKDVAKFQRNDFAFFPSASIGWSFLNNNELKLNYSRRIRRPFGPQLNTFENISDPSEVHLGNPGIQPEYSNAVELSYIKTWSQHSLAAAAYLRHNSDMISHISFLAPMSSDPNVNTMYYGHANVGNMTNTGVEIISRNSFFNRLTLTTTVNLYNTLFKAWATSYPMHGEEYEVRGERQNRFVWDIRCMASVKLPWDMTFQATGRYNSRRVTAQGILDADWDVEAGLRKSLGDWKISLVCKDIFNSRKTSDILYGNGYTQSISKWTGGRTLRLSVAYSFGKSDSHSYDRHNHVDTGGYGEQHHH